MERPVIGIVGPTCSGKTYLGLKLANELNSEIISVDSRQFYKYLNIGTAKPGKSELQNVKHHFINFLAPDDNYNVSRFEKDAEEIIEKLITQNKTPIIVGGSGLYIKALIDGIFETADKDEDYRERLMNLKRKHGNEYLYDMLVKVDLFTAKKLLPQNWKRVMRALEVYHLTGLPIWKHHQTQSKTRKFDYKQFGINWDRQVLNKRIEIRVDKMIDDGLVDEVKSILDRGYDKNINSLNTVGYKEIISYLEGNVTLSRAIELIKRNTRRYAKRQMTWFGKDERINWYDVHDEVDLDKLAKQILISFK